MECKINKYGITPFSGEDFTNWLFRVKLVLEIEELLETLEEEYLRIENLSEIQKKKNAKAKNIIIQCMSDSHLEILKECSTACEMIKKMYRKFTIKCHTK